MLPLDTLKFMGKVVKDVAVVNLTWLVVVTPQKVRIFNPIFALEPCPMDQFSSHRVPERHHIKAIDSSKQVLMLLPYQVVILIEFFELFASL